MKKKIFSLAKLPSSLRSYLIRKKLFINDKLIRDEGIVFKVAETEDELMQAFGLVQSMYEKANIVNSDQTGLRITKFHLLPTTKVLVAKKDEKVIGTLTVILDTPLGLAMDDFISLEELRKSSLRICEISSFAIAPKWRSNSKGLFLPLSLYAVWYAKYIIGASRLVIVTNERARHIYQDIFLFQPLTLRAQNYSAVKDSKAFGQHLDLKSIENRYLEIYYRKPYHQNLFQHFSNPSWKEQLFRETHKYNIVPVMNYPESVLDKMFERFETLNSLEDKDKQTIYNHYAILKKEFGKNIFISRRRYPRFYTKMKTDIVFRDKLYDTECIQISKGGVCLKLPHELEISDEGYRIVVYLDSHEQGMFLGTIA